MSCARALAYRLLILSLGFSAVALTPAGAASALALGWVGPTAADDQKDTAQPCVILKRMGPADQVTSHLYSFGIRGKQFQYVEGQLPKGVKFHGRLTDHDVRKIVDAGGKTTIIDSHYTDQELQNARKSCGQEAPRSDEKAKSTESGAPAASQTGETSATTPPANQPTTTSPAVAPAPGPTPVPPQPTVQPPAPASVASENLATVVMKSTPDGADITVDGKYVGSTPSTVRLAAGDHTILIEKSGFKSWQRTMSVSPGGIATIDAALEKQ